MASLLLWLMLAATPPAASTPPPRAEAVPEKSSPAAGATKKAAAPEKKRGEGKKKQVEEAPAPDAGTPPARPVFRWDIPGLIGWVESPGQQTTDGVPMHLQVAHSKEKLGTLIQHFADRFRAAGFFISTSPQALASPVTEPILTALDTEKLTAYTVIFQQNPDGTVTLILGTSDVSQYNPSASPRLDWAPVMAGAEQVTRSNVEGSEMAIYAVKATPAQVQEFYRQELGRAGFVEDPDEPGTFQRGTELLRVRTYPEGDLLMVGLSRKLGVQPR